MTDRDDLTPMMRQYRDLKRRYPDHVLLFRLGDFYETFFEDAELAARLAPDHPDRPSRRADGGDSHHASDGYIARLVRAGQKIAVCEQLEAPEREKKLLRRDVVRIITPGTLTDTAYLEGAANNFLMAVIAGRDATGVALVDVSTGRVLGRRGRRRGTRSWRRRSCGAPRRSSCLTPCAPTRPSWRACRPRARP